MKNVSDVAIIPPPLISKWLGGRVVMQRTATPLTPVRFRPQPPKVSRIAALCPDGEIGRRKGLKIPRWQHRAGSIPAPGTIFNWAPADLLLGQILHACERSFEHLSPLGDVCVFRCLVW